MYYYYYYNHHHHHHHHHSSSSSYYYYCYCCCCCCFKSVQSAAALEAVNSCSRLITLLNGQLYTNDHPSGYIYSAGVRLVPSTSIQIEFVASQNPHCCRQSAYRHIATFVYVLRQAETLSTQCQCVVTVVAMHRWVLNLIRIRTPKYIYIYSSFLGS